MRIADCELRIVSVGATWLDLARRIRNPKSAIRNCLFVLTACTPTTTRPDFAPFPEAQVAVVRASFEHVTALATRWLTAQGIHLAQSSPRDGYLETAWESGVKLRCWVDPASPGQSRVTVEATYRPMADPSRTARDLERPAPLDGDGQRLAQRLLTALSDSLGVVR